MKLSEITPVPFYSVVQMPLAPLLPMVVIIAVIAGPAVIFQWPYQWAFVILGVAAGASYDPLIHRLRQRRRDRLARMPPDSAPPAPEFDVEARTKTWRDLLADQPFASLVLFSYGTCIVLITRATTPPATRSPC